MDKRHKAVMAYIQAKQDKQGAATIGTTAKRGANGGEVTVLIETGQRVWIARFYTEQDYGAYISARNTQLALLEVAKGRLNDLKDRHDAWPVPFPGATSRFESEHHTICTILASSPDECDEMLALREALGGE